MRRFKLSRVLPLRSKIEPDIQEKLTVCARVFAAYKTKLNHRQRRASPPPVPSDCAHTVSDTAAHVFGTPGE